MWCSVLQYIISGYFSLLNNSNNLNLNFSSTLPVIRNVNFTIFFFLQDISNETFNHDVILIESDVKLYVIFINDYYCPDYLNWVEVIYFLVNRYDRTSLF